MLSKIINYFGTDGLLHIICSSIIVSILGWIFPLWIAMIVTLLVGIGKEVVWDKILKKGCCDKKDIVADVIGILIGIL